MEKCGFVLCEMYGNLDAIPGLSTSPVTDSNELTKQEETIKTLVAGAFISASLASRDQLEYKFLTQERKHSHLNTIRVAKCGPHGTTALGIF